MSDRMTVLVVEPGETPYIKEINGLKEMQAIVGGSIEAAYPHDDPIALVCNAEGKLQGLPYNRPLLDENGLPYDIVRGTFFLAGLGAEDFVSLTEEQIQRYKDLYDNVMVVTAAKEQPQREKSEEKKKRGTSYER